MGAQQSREEAAQAGCGADIFSGMCCEKQGENGEDAGKKRLLVQPGPLKTTNREIPQTNVRVSPTQLGLRAKQQNEFRGYPLIEEEELQRYLEICDDSERPDTRHWKNLGFALAKMCNHDRNAAMQAMNIKQIKMCMHAIHIFYQDWDQKTARQRNEMLANECTMLQKDYIRSLGNPDSRQEFMEGAERALSKARTVTAGSVPIKIDTALHQGPRSPASSGSTPSSLHGRRKSHEKSAGLHISPSSLSGQGKDFGSSTESPMSPALFLANEQRRIFQEKERRKSLEGDSPMSSDKGHRRKSVKNHERRGSVNNRERSRSVERNEEKWGSEFMEDGPEYKQAPTDTSRPSVRTTRDRMVQKGWGIAVEHQIGKVAEHDLARFRRSSFESATDFVQPASSPKHTNQKHVRAYHNEVTGVHKLVTVESTIEH